MSSPTKGLSERANGEVIARWLDLSAPVDLERVLSFYNVNLEKNLNFERAGYSGEVGFRAEQPYIWVNPGENKERQRFTIAHELGHFLIHLHKGMPGTAAASKIFRDDVSTLKRGGKWNIEEQQANTFAAQLLMPTFLIYSEAKQLMESYGDKVINRDCFVSDMAERFEVSIEAMAHRLDDLGLFRPNPQS